MKNLLTIFILLGGLLINSSCKNAGDKSATAESAGTDTTQNTILAAPFKVLAVNHTVKDFDVWKAVYDEGESGRKASGLSTLSIARDMDNPNMIYVFNLMSDVQKAKDFSADPALKAAMEKGGVSSAPTIKYMDVSRYEVSPSEFKGRVRITHTVKDFDAWLKVYDTEGKEARAANGMIDRALSRSMDDPNLVTVSFAISDLNKVKARLNDPALKKLMSEAGVVGMPEINFFQAID